MKNLFLVRHSNAEDYNFDIDDFNRKLIPKGIEKAHKVCAELKRLGVKPGVLLSSPANRAIETAFIFAEEFGIENTQIIKEDFIYDYFRPSDLLDYLKTIDNTSDNVWLFGHNPVLARIADFFSSSNINSFPKCGVMGYSFNCDNWADLDLAEVNRILYINPKKF